MRKIKVLCVLIFLLSVGLFAYTAIEINAEIDKNGPEITVPSSMIELSIHDDESIILEGVTAYDSKDGDATSTLVVENISNMMTDGVRTASIVAFDSDNNINRATREIRYTDYVSPEFHLSAPLRFPDVYSNITGLFTAQDCLDGDISNRIHVAFEDTIESEEYKDVKVVFSVANSIGDVTRLPATIEFYDKNGESRKPQITLSDYLVNLEVGESIDPMDYVESVFCNGKSITKDRRGVLRWDELPEEEYNDKGELVNEKAFEDADLLVTRDLLKIDNPVVFTNSGVYEITYSITSFDGIEGKTRLIVCIK